MDHRLTADPDSAADRVVADLYQAASFETPRIRWTESPPTFVAALREERLRLIGDQPGLSGCLCLSCRGASVHHLVAPDPGPINAVAWNVLQALDREVSGGRSTLEVEALHTESVYTRRGRREHRSWSDRWSSDRRRQAAMTSPKDPTVRFADMWSFLSDVAVLCARGLVTVAEGRLHATDGPAGLWPDGWSVYAREGVVLPTIAADPERITMADVMAEPNAEIRRHLIDTAGPDRLLAEAGAVCLDDDSARGSLWHLPDLAGRGRPMAMVRVVDSTPDEHGVRRVYWIHVPPHLRTAAEAVAWTFDLSVGEYRPEVET